MSISSDILYIYIGTEWSITVIDVCSEVDSQRRVTSTSVPDGLQAHQQDIASPTGTPTLLYSTSDVREQMFLTISLPFQWLHSLLIFFLFPSET